MTALVNACWGCQYIDFWQRSSLSRSIWKHVLWEATCWTLNSNSQPYFYYQNGRPMATHVQLSRLQFFWPQVLLLQIYTTPCKPTIGFDKIRFVVYLMQNMTHIAKWLLSSKAIKYLITCLIGVPSILLCGITGRCLGLCEIWLSDSANSSVCFC